MVRLHHNGIYHYAYKLPFPAWDIDVRRRLFAGFVLDCSSGVTCRRMAGPVLVSREAVPTGIEYKVLGTVKANNRAGYESAESLYPLLAAEAKKLGANAVVNAKGGHTVTAFSWAAAYVSGTAIRIGDTESLRRLSGSYY